MIRRFLIASGDHNELLYRVSDIDWDTDGEEIADLPESAYVWADDEDEALEAVSDEAGWCIEGAVVEEIDPEALGSLGDTPPWEAAA